MLQFCFGKCPKKTYTIWRSKICNINFWIENTPSSPLEVFRKFKNLSLFYCQWRLLYCNTNLCNFSAKTCNKWPQVATTRPTFIWFTQKSREAQIASKSIQLHRTGAKYASYAKVCDPFAMSALIVLICKGSCGALSQFRSRFVANANWEAKRQRREVVHDCKEAERSLTVELLERTRSSGS